MSHGDVLRDERTVAAENESYRWAYLVLSFGLLVAVAWRSFARQEAAWDLLALVVLGGFVSATYQGRARVLTWRWARHTIVVAVLAAVLAAVLVVLR
jgi:hypothetical protein